MARPCSRGANPAHQPIDETRKRPVFRSFHQGLAILRFGAGLPRKQRSRLKNEAQAAQVTDGAYAENRLRWLAIKGPQHGGQLVKGPKQKRNVCPQATTLRFMRQTVKSMTDQSFSGRVHRLDDAATG